MKNLIYLFTALMVLALLTTTTFAQQNPDGKGQNKYRFDSKWIDLDGDGICDNFGKENQEAKKVMNRNRKNIRSQNGDGDGTGNGYGDGSGLRPQDGTGFGRKLGGGDGTGNCDGTGSQGKGRRGGK